LHLLCKHMHIEVKIHHWKEVHEISLLGYGVCQLKSVQKPCLIPSCGQGAEIYISAWQVGHTVAQLAEALCYKLEGHEYPDGISDGVIGIIHWRNPSAYTMALGVNSASNRSKYQEYFLGNKVGRCVGLTALPPSCDDCLVKWEPQPPGTLRACPGLYRNCCT